MNQLYITVKHEHEYGEFFVSEREPQPRSDGHLRYSATWVCYSSFGTYGHHWSDMGSPFSEFICQVDEHYLLGKIASKHTSPSKTLVSVREELARLLSDGECTEEAYTEAAEAVETIEAEDSGEFLIAHLYECSELSECGFDWHDIETQEFDPQAVGFAKKLWPKFVEAVNAQRLAKTSEELYGVRSETCLK